MRASYTFTGSWVVPAPVEAVAEVVVDLAAYPSWWPQVVAVAKITDDTARVLCRSSLPYTLDLVLTARSVEPPVLEVGVAGDLEGVVRWTVSPEEGGTRMDLHQEVEVSGALALASYVGRPLLRWNHDRMMTGCIEGLTATLR